MKTKIQNKNEGKKKKNENKNCPNYIQLILQIKDRIQIQMKNYIQVIKKLDLLIKNQSLKKNLR